MSDIPVGSPPVPPGRHAAPGGWYVDPVDPARERYWDGWQWSRNTRPREATYSQAAVDNAHRYSAQAGYPLQPRYPSHLAATTADGVRLAGWWWRVLAVAIDNLITSVVVTVVAFPIWRPMYTAFASYFQAVVDAQRSGAPRPGFDATNLFPLRDQILLTAVSLAVGLVYHVAFLRWRGATPGKLICGMRVVPVDRGRSRGGLGWTAAAIRASIWVLPGINSLFGMFTIVDVLFPLWQPKRQALHDLAAKTQVVRPGPEPRTPNATNFR